jgi:DNA ligase-1
MPFFIQNARPKSRLFKLVATFVTCTFGQTTIIDDALSKNILVQHENNMLSPSMPLILAKLYTEQNDPQDFLVSEKLDGVRAYWDGRLLRFKSGRIIHAPEWFIANFPRFAMDGELWIARGQFEKLSGVVRRLEPVDAEWRMVRYRLFEAPSHAGVFAERIAQLDHDVKASAIAWLDVLPQMKIANNIDLKLALAEIAKKGGEGLMLHRSDAPFQVGRSEALLKLKPQLDDDAIVVAHEEGRGKFSNMLGALVVMGADGRRFRLGTGLSDTQRRKPPVIGAKVTFRYRDRTASGLPKFPSFLRVKEFE